MQRIADRDADADQPLQLLGEPGEVRGAARDHDLADAQRSGLVLVELERGDELAREGLELAPNRFASASACSWVSPSGTFAVASESSRLTGSASEGAQSSSRAIATSSVEPPQSSTRVNSQTRPSETAKVERSWPIETTTSAASDGGLVRRQRARRARAGARRPRGRSRRAGCRPSCRRRRSGRSARGRRRRAGPGARCWPVVVDALAEHVVVEHGLLDRDRQRLLGAEADRVLELLRVVDARDLEDADADAVVGDAEPDALARKLVLAEERAQRVGEQLGLAQLAADDDAVARGRSRATWTSSG